MNDKPLTAKQQKRLAELVAESARRQSEGLKIFRPLPYQVPIFTSKASEFLVRGGNRSGKTICVAAEVASAITGMPIIGPDNEPLPLKYPTDRPLLVWLIGFGQPHIGATFYRMLFRRNPEFRMIRDLETGQWRAYLPWLEEDKQRAKESRMAPPMVPKRLIDPKGWAWQDKASRHFTVCRMKNETEIHAFTSKGEPKMGDPVDLIWIDERIMFSKHYAEWQARISDRKGRIIWSSWPGYGNPALVDLIRRAERERGELEPDVQEIVLRFSDNPYIDPKEKEKRLKGWSEQDRKSRDEGELVEGRSRVYPTFNTVIHTTPCEHEPSNDKADLAIRDNNNRIPKDWCRFLSVDPGHAHPGALFCAVCPPELGSCGVVYDELYLPHTDAWILAREIARKTDGVMFEAFVIDAHAARQTPMGFSKTILEQYMEAFDAHTLQSRTTGSGFLWGTDDVEGGVDLVRDRLLIRRGRPWLRVLKDECPVFRQQMEWYQKHQDAHGYVLDRPAPRQVDPLCDCVRYWVGMNPSYMPPEPTPRAASSHYLYWRDQWREEKPPEQETMCLGPGAMR